MIDYRRAEEGDLPALLAMAAEAKARLAAMGVDQWQTGYPAEEDFRRDIQRGDGWLFTADGAPAGYICISRRPEAVYAELQGEWLSCAGPYVCLHRLMTADAARGKGLGNEMLSLAEDFARGWSFAGIRVDTQAGNFPMRRLLQRNGYEVCGAVKLRGGPEDGQTRVALEKLLR